VFEGQCQDLRKPQDTARQSAFWLTKCKAAHIVIIRYEGPKGGPGHSRKMPLTPPAYLKSNRALGPSPECATADDVASPAGATLGPSTIRSCFTRSRRWLAMHRRLVRLTAQRCLLIDIPNRRGASNLLVQRCEERTLANPTAIAASRQDRAGSPDCNSARRKGHDPTASASCPAWLTRLTRVPFADKASPTVKTLTAQLVYWQPASPQLKGSSRGSARPPDLYAALAAKTPASDNMACAPHLAEKKSNERLNSNDCPVPLVGTN